MPTPSADDLLLEEGTDLIWELFHENSKTSRVERHPVYGSHPSDVMVIQMMNQLRRVKEYGDRAKVPLPRAVPSSTRGFDDVVMSRVSARSFTDAWVTVGAIARILTTAYGVTRSNETNSFPRPFRSIPSGGALYPLEVYVHAPRVEGLAAGLYHYDPEDESLDVLALGARTDDVAALLIQEELGRQAAATIIVSAVFARSVFKYGDRGYRFVLLEAGHLGQNVVLTAASLGLAAVPVGGYLDRAADRFLHLDGVNESVVYMIHVGHADDQWNVSPPSTVIT